MTVLPTGARVSVHYRDAGRQVAAGLGWVLFALGWLLARSLRLVASVLGGLLFGAGWIARRVVWPSLLWAGAAVKLGWDQGAKPGGRRGTA